MNDSTNDTLSMREPRQKLLAIEDLLPNLDPSIIMLAKFLATRLADEDMLLPEGFNMKCQLALYDLGKGTDGFTGKPIHSSLAGCPPQLYGILRWYLPTIATAVLPAEFARETCRVMESVVQRSTDAQLA